MLKIFTILSLFTSSVFAAKVMSPPKLTVKIISENKNSDTLEFKSVVILEEGWHVNSNKPEDEFAYPTKIEVIGDGVEFGHLKYPEPKKKYVPVLKQDMLLYEGTFEITGKFWWGGDEYGKSEVEFKFFYQACSDNLCLKPTSVSFYFNPDGGLAISPSQQNKSSSSRINPKSSNTKKYKDYSRVKKKKDTNPYDDSLLIVVFVLLIGGLALNLTPCVYPLLAVTISLFGGQGERSLSRRVIMSLLYVLGMIISFSLLGVFAALSGSLFGSALQSPMAQIFISLIFFALALSSFGLFELTLPSSWMGTAMKASNTGGYIGGILAGLFAGVLASPCIGPFVLSLIVYVAQKNNVLTGLWMFGTLALGMGLPYLVLGVFTGLLQNLPKSGSWMVDVKKILGIVLLGLVNYYLRGFMSESINQIILGALIVYGCLYINPFQIINNVPKWISTLLRAGALIGLIYGLSVISKEMGFNPMQGELIRDGSNQNSPSLIWKDYSDLLLEKGMKEGRYVIIDFESKIWCAACREMEEKTYSQLIVIDALTNFEKLKVDVDHHPQEKVLTKKYKIGGIPTAVIIDVNGNVVHQIVGFIPPEEFVEQIKNLPPNEKNQIESIL